MEAVWLLLAVFFSVLGYCMLGYFFEIVITGECDGNSWYLLWWPVFLIYHAIVMILSIVRWLGLWIHNNFVKK